jgi:putative SOS response-associated peptidase YedK
MCGRFTQSYTWRELVGLYRLNQPARNLRPRYNIAPTTAIDVVRSGDSVPELVPMRWGVIPGWWKKTAKEVPSTFNARAETVAQKPMFRSAFKGTRCIVPASGYYEWRTAEGGQAALFHQRGGWVGAVDRGPMGSMERPGDQRGGFERYVDRDCGQ